MEINFYRDLHQISVRVYVARENVWHDENALCVIPSETQSVIVSFPVRFDQLAKRNL